MTGLTEAIGRYVADRGIPVSDEAATIIKSGFIDAAGTLVAGRNESPVSIVRRHAEEVGFASMADSSLFFGAERVAAEGAALINGTACHVFDYDDVGLRAHPSTVLVPAILAEAERRALTGADAIRAYLVGYEVWAELNAREPDAIHVKGWHPTSAVGVIGAAAAIAHLIGLDAERARNAVALAASMSGGVVANFGTMAKSFQVGRAASAGILAARLAEGGMDGASDALERSSGLLNAMSMGAVDLSPPAEPIGRVPRLLARKLSFKKYPVCYCSHRVIDAVLDMAGANDLSPASVCLVRARVGDTQISILRNHAPKTGLEAKFSLEFAIAAAIFSRKVGLRQLADDYVMQPEIQTLIDKVVVEIDDSVCPVEPAFSVNDRVVIETNDRRVLDSGDIRFARGHASVPLQEGELKRKFLDCCDGSPFDAARLYMQLDRLEDLPDMRALSAN